MIASEQQPRNEIMIYTWNILILFALEMNDPHMAYSILRTTRGEPKQARRNLLILTLARIRQFAAVLPLMTTGNLKNETEYFVEEVVCLSVFFLVKSSLNNLFFHFRWKK